MRPIARIATKAEQEEVARKAKKLTEGAIPVEKAGQYLRSAQGRLEKWAKGERK
jgi:carotenoid cleavage dioxygenase-like enzyme